MPTMRATVGSYVARSGFCLALAAALILGAVRFAFSWQPVYTYAIEAYHADEATGIPRAELLRASHAIRNYFTSSRRDLDLTVLDGRGRSLPLFNEREIAHMRDVKALVQRVYLLLDLAVAAVMLYGAVSLRHLRRSMRQLARDVLAASLFTLMLIVGFGAAASTSFDSLFTEFHLLSFSNDFWQLDPSRDRLVQIFPQGFWFDVTLFVGLLALTGALLLALCSGAYLLLSRQSEPAAAPTIEPAAAARPAPSTDSA